MWHSSLTLKCKACPIKRDYLGMGLGNNNVLEYFNQRFAADFTCYVNDRMLHCLKKNFSSSHYVYARQIYLSV
jgi:hypothetical protein